MKLSFFIEDLDEFVLSLDKKGNILYANKEFIKNAQMSTKEFYGKNILKLFDLKKKIDMNLLREYIKNKILTPYRLEIKDKQISEKFEIKLYPFIFDNRIQGFFVKGEPIEGVRRKMLDIRNRFLGITEVFREISSFRSPKEFFEEVIEQACRLIKAPMGILRILDETGLFRVLASRGFSEEYLHIAESFKIGEGLSGKSAERKRIYCVSNVKNSSLLKYKDDLLKEGVQSIIIVPIIFGNTVLGTIGVADKKMRKFTKEEISLLKTFASQVAVVINLIRQEEIINESYFDTLNALVLAMEAKDPYTRGHSERVTRISLNIAKKLGLDEESMKYLKFCTLVHDIGKIAIPDSILLKPSKLTLDEWAQIQLHPVRGKEILSPLKFLTPGMDIVKHHHERYDGKGYPEGLKKNKIPLLARIVAIADAFDAMCSDRPYRKKYPVEYAIKEIERNKGKQFDPEIASVFLSMIV